MTKTIHPPGGATALIAVMPSDKIHELGYWYAFSPVLTGCIILLFVALICNNMTSHRHYPTNKKFTHQLKRIFKR
jgi:CBS domain-containing membrane protein